MNATSTKTYDPGLYNQVQHLEKKYGEKALFTLGSKLVELTEFNCVVIKQRDLHEPREINVMYFDLGDLQSIVETLNEVKE